MQIIQKKIEETRDTSTNMWRMTYCIHILYCVRYTGTTTYTYDCAARWVSVSGGLCSPASAVGPRASDAGPRNRLGSMSPSCAGDSMPGSPFTSQSRHAVPPSHTLRRSEARGFRARSQRPVTVDSHPAILT